MNDRTLIAPKNSLSEQSMTDVEPILLDFVKTKANSFVKWELIRFFDDNPHTTDTAENLAKYLGRKTLPVKSELEELVESGVLKKTKLAGLSIYSLANDQGTRILVDQFILAFENRHFRIKAVSQILAGVR